jgi:DNA-binding GntR family transcriptional regulator
MDELIAIEKQTAEVLDQPGWVCDRIRDDIISGRLDPNQRLKIAELTTKYGTSTNPVREALQQLRGEGLVIIEPNRGARVRPIDEDFVRDITEVQVLIAPALTRWFVSIAETADIDQLIAVQKDIEELNFTDLTKHGELDKKFHQIIYERHYNRFAAELVNRREILRTISRRFPISYSRRDAVIIEHRELIDRIRAHDAEGAAAVVARHVEGGGRHIVEQMSVARRLASNGS